MGSSSLKGNPNKKKAHIRVLAGEPTGKTAAKKTAGSAERAGVLKGHRRVVELKKRVAEKGRGEGGTGSQKDYWCKGGSYENERIWFHLSDGF